MPKKNKLGKEALAKVKEENKKIKSKGKKVTEKWKEIMEWKIKNSTQKRFFSLEEKEQSLLETTYMIVVQMCPELSWEDFLKRLSKTDKYNTWASSIIKSVIRKR